jgi:hypothetical protein
MNPPSRPDSSHTLLQSPDTSYLKDVIRPFTLRDFSYFHIPVRTGIIVDEVFGAKILCDDEFGIGGGCDNCGSA